MSSAARRFLVIGALLLAAATALGAWAAHGLQALLEPAAVANFRTGVEYHFYHSLGLLGVGLLIDRIGSLTLLQLGGWLLVAGIVMFSGSLYLLAFVSATFLWPVTPLGGLCFIAAWLCLAVAIMQAPRS